MCIFLFLLLISCANIIPPTGGEFDHDPPQLISSNPQNKSVGFDSETILLQFDEYIELKNKNSIRVSPVCEPPPKIMAKGKQIELDFSCSFDNSVTYTINFGKSICDLNEGNILENFTYVFSTGERLDSMNLRGSAKDNYSYQEISGAMIGLYKNNDFSRPYYYTYANDDGDFLIENIKDDSYLIFGFDDKNQNLKYDFGEIVSIPTAVADFNKNYDLKFFYENDYSQKINVSNTSTNTLNFEHGLNPDSIIILNTDGVWNYGDISSVFWFNNAPPVIKYLINGVVDSVKIYNTKHPKVMLNTVNDVEEIINTKSVLIKSNSPIKKCVSSGFSWLSGQKAIAAPKQINLFAVEVPIPDTDLPEDKLIINPGGILFETGLENDSTSFIFDFDAVNYGSLNIKGVSLGNNLILELFNDEGVIKKRKLKGETNVNYIHPGVYKLRVFEDLNNDNTWTPGVVNESKLSEFVYIYPDLIKIKPNWDLEIIINLNK
tara:strand:+ start:869 stop:2338 length:1470 start_codon:yes stop_codon:yes gene_type:complete